MAAFAGYEGDYLPQTKLYGEMNSPFLLNEHGDPQFFQVFRNSLKKNIFEEEEKLDSGTQVFLENSSQLGVFRPW